jgi:hypothetical protein
MPDPIPDALIFLRPLGFHFPKGKSFFPKFLVPRIGTPFVSFFRILVFPWSCFSMCLFAQSKVDVLPSGIYNHLRSDKPLVLDTGNYTFNGLEMDLSKEERGKGRILLDARKARFVLMDHCRLVAGPADTGLLTNGRVKLAFNRFTGMAVAVGTQLPSDSITHFLAYRNVFSDNGVCIDLRPALAETIARFELQLKCNAFEVSPGSEQGKVVRKGLVLAKGLLLQSGLLAPSNSIGGPENPMSQGLPYPNGNIWPTAQKDRSQLPIEGGGPLDLHHPAHGWPNFRNWIAIDNQTGKEVAYYRYENEFVGWGPAIRGMVDFPLPNNHRNLALDPDLVDDTCIYKTQQPAGFANPAVCEQLIDEQPFLLPTLISAMKPDPSKTLVLPSDKQHWLGEPIAVGQYQMLIPMWVPDTIQRAVLQYLDPVSRKVLQNNPIRPRGWAQAMLDMDQVPAGKYLCRLMADGVAVQYLEIKKE